MAPQPFRQASSSTYSWGCSGCLSMTETPLNPGQMLIKNCRSSLNSLESSTNPVSGMARRKCNMPLEKTLAGGDTCHKINYPQQTLDLSLIGMGALLPVGHHRSNLCHLRKGGGGGGIDIVISLELNSIPNHTMT